MPGLCNDQIIGVLDNVTTFIVLRDIQTFGFLLIADTQTENGVNDFKNHECHDSGPYNRCYHTD